MSADVIDFPRRRPRRVEPERQRLTAEQIHEKIERCWAKRDARRQQKMMEQHAIAARRYNVVSPDPMRPWDLAAYRDDATLSDHVNAMMSEVSEALARNDPDYACGWLEKTWRLLRRGLRKAEKRKIVINRFIRREREKRLAGKGGAA
jgi:hypothetical protein